jgi:hypothetical protein
MNSNHEQEIGLAIKALENGDFQSGRAAAAAYNIPRSTLRD